MNLGFHKFWVTTSLLERLSVSQEDLNTARNIGRQINETQDFQPLTSVTNNSTNERSLPVELFVLARDSTCRAGGEAIC